MENTLYLECYSGISGDMTVAALLDLGADREVLEKALQSLPISGFRTEITKIKKSGIDACDFRVILDHDHENHDHDMQYLHGKEEVQEHEAHHHHTHEHRGIQEIKEIVEAGDMTETARKLTMRIFTILAEAEGKAHHMPVEEVHFHEVGAVDSIVDIVAAAVCLDALNITEVIIPELWEGKGTVRCQHGILPVPVPAVSNIVEQNRLKIKITDVEGELVTPTGAAIAAAIQTTDRLPAHFSIEKTGIGAGKRQYSCPGILRAMLISKTDEYEDRICKLEANIDDCSGEILGYTMQLLMEAGARDVYYVPAFMKKNRPAWILHVICAEQKRRNLEEIIFRETTTIGIRRVEMQRSILKREEKILQTSLGEVQVKVCKDGERLYVYPEYESLLQLCKNQGLSYKEGYDRIIFETKDML